MMNEQHPLFYRNLLRLHAVITRGLKVVQENSQLFTQTGFPNDTTRTGFLDYAQSLVIVMRLHFETEENVSFPYIHAKLSSFRVEPMVLQHQQMQPHLAEMQTVVEKIGASTQPNDLLRQLDSVSSTLRVLWRMHSNAEEGYFASASATARGLTEDEQVEVAQQTEHYNQEHTIKPSLTVPFILYNLHPDQRAEMAHSMEKSVIQQLVPIVWKDEWAPMKPFLLD